jgi:hypothetical protein
MPQDDFSLSNSPTIAKNLNILMQALTFPPIIMSLILSTVDEYLGFYIPSPQPYVYLFLDEMVLSSDPN